jgi:(5-formylfuran-3-yl)methyl phosphate transaminase
MLSRPRRRSGLNDPEQTGQDVALMRSTYDARRRFIVRRLRELGFGIRADPTGAFYVFANARHLSTDSYSLAFEILEKTGVGVTPDIDFGRHGEGYLRFSYANSMENTAEGLDRIEKFLTLRSRVR